MYTCINACSTCINILHVYQYIVYISTMYINMIDSEESDLIHCIFANVLNLFFLEQVIERSDR